MAEYDFDMGILGGGSAGLTIASGSAQLGAKTLLIEREEKLGGDCLHYGCVPSKTLIRTSRVRHLMRNAARFGLRAGELPPVDFQEVVKRIRSVIGVIQEHDSPGRFCKLGVKVEFGDALFSDEHALKLNGKIYTARNWVIATGSSPFIPPIPGLAQTPFITNKDLFYLDRLPASMIILGGGPIGIEMAQAFCRLGTKVTVLQHSNQILPREDKDMADLLMGILADEGVDFRLNADITGVRDLGNEKEVLVKDAEGIEISLRAERILVATGRAANTAGLDLQNTGIEFGARGIPVDAKMRTRHTHIYAAGDVTGSYQFTHAAGYEGGIVVGNALFHVPRKADYSLLPWCTYTDPELASLGMNETRARQTGIDYSVWKEEFRENDRSLAEGESSGMMKMILDGKGKPLGVQILGVHAGELLGTWIAAMNGKIGLSTLAGAVHPYPTLGEINKKIAGAYMAKKIFSPTVKKTLAFLFDLKGRACE